MTSLSFSVIVLLDFGDDTLSRHHFPGSSREEKSVNTLSLLIPVFQGAAGRTLALPDAPWEKKNWEMLCTTFSFQRGTVHI